MNGRFLLDTNAVIALLNGDKNISNIIKNAKWIGISVITELEFLSFPNLSDTDKILFQEFKKRIEVISIDTKHTTLIDLISEVRQRFRLKLPDAIIAATAIQLQSSLISNDVAFEKVSNLNLKTF